MVGEGPCNQYPTTDPTTGQVVEVTASGGYMVSQTGLPLASPGHMRGLTLQRLFDQVLATGAPNLFMSSFNEHIGGRQAPATGSNLGFNQVRKGRGGGRGRGGGGVLDEVCVPACVECAGASQCACAWYAGMPQSSRAWACACAPQPDLEPQQQLIPRAPHEPRSTTPSRRIPSIHHPAASRPCCGSPLPQSPRVQAWPCACTRLRPSPPPLPLPPTPSS